MIRIQYTKTKHNSTAGPFVISATLILTIEISNIGELILKNGDGSIVFVEICSNVRNAKYRARKKLEELGYPILTEMRNRE